MAGEKILIVDDEESMVQFLSILLSKEGYEVHVARSGRDALQKAEEENFDVVVTDIKMPGDSGSFPASRRSTRASRLSSERHSLPRNRRSTP